MNNFRGGQGGGGGGFRPRSNYGGPREEHDAVCSQCGKDCKVPFRPAEGKPVYCKECFMKKKNESN